MESERDRAVRARYVRTLMAWHQLSPADLAELLDVEVATIYKKLDGRLGFGQVVVHNSVRPTRRLGSRGFRVWYDSPTAPGLTPCDCDWAPELGAHYRVDRTPS
jgi:hypothetical protein